jgi:hypothetical protein
MLSKILDLSIHMAMDLGERRGLTLVNIRGMGTFEAQQWIENGLEF